MRLSLDDLQAFRSVSRQVEDTMRPSIVEHPLDLRIVFADDEGEFMRLWHGIHDDKQINWRNR